MYWSPAQMLAQTRPGALGAVLCYSCVPVAEFGESWPNAVPVQIHGMDADPIFVGEGDIDAAREIVLRCGENVARAQRPSLRQRVRNLGDRNAAVRRLLAGYRSARRSH